MTLLNNNKKWTYEVVVTSSLQTLWAVSFIPLLLLVSNWFYCLFGLIGAALLPLFFLFSEKAPCLTNPIPVNLLISSNIYTNIYKTRDHYVS